MYDLALHFLIWDLKAAAVLAVALGVLVVLQGAYRWAAALVQRTGSTPFERPVGTVRLPSPRLPEAIGSRR